jgi:hypothetical protein
MQLGCSMSCKRTLSTKPLSAHPNPNPPRTRPKIAASYMPPSLSMVTRPRCGRSSSLDSRSSQFELSLTWVRWWFNARAVASARQPDGSATRRAMQRASVWCDKRPTNMSYVAYSFPKTLLLRARLKLLLLYTWRECVCSIVMQG